VAALAKARKIAVITGEATFTSPTALSVKGAAGTTELSAKNFVIATGSAPVELPFLKFNGRRSSRATRRSRSRRAPTLVVVGGGAIGLELGSVWARLGSDVTVVEFLPKIVAAYDDDIVRTFSRLLQKQGLKIETGAKVTGLEGRAAAVLTAERDGKASGVPGGQDPGRRRAPAVHGRARPRQGGRRPRREEGGSRWTGACAPASPASGRSATSSPAPCSPTRPRRTAIAVAEWIAGKAGHVNWDLVPAIVYTDPEVASVGLGEDAAKAKGLSRSTSASSTSPPTGGRSPTTRPTGS
jgi:dihydrolipoamide dehydrogenase